MRQIISTLLLLALSPLLTAGVQEPKSVRSWTQIGGESRRDDVKDKKADFIEAVKRGDAAVVGRLLADGIDPNVKDEAGELALGWAIRFNRIEVTEALLARGARVNETEDDGDTPLMVAAACGRADFVRALLAKGADVNARDRGGHTPLISAAMGAMFKSAPEQTVKKIYGEEDGADFKDLLKRMGNEHTKVIDLLLERGADVNVQAEDCHLSALMIAAMIGDVEIVRSLLSHGADANLKSGGWTALAFVTVAMTRELKRKLEDDPDFDDQRSRQAFIDWMRGTAQSRKEITLLLRHMQAQ
jgi:ankyrin repeat protein